MSIRSLRLALCLHAVGFVFSPGASAQTDLGSDDIDRIARAVVRVVALQGGEEISSGSGTLVDRGGLIFTNRHVVEEAEDYVVEILEDPNEPPVPRYRARLLGYSMDVDFAQLQIDRDERGRPVAADGINLPFLSSVTTDAQRGDRVFVFGYPGIGDGYLALTQGTVSTIRNGTVNSRRLRVWYQTDAQIAPGNSGGLAVNTRGEMVGIPTTVRTERLTGGRLGGILAMSAVRATLDAGLETDLSQIAAATTAPVIQGGTLDYNETPTFGSVLLSAGFEPDPYALEMLSGGEVAATYLGGECMGYAAVAPDFRISWSGTSAELNVLFVADDGDDTTLLVNRPDGSWACNDDADGTLDPMVVLRNPSPGQYDVWVGSFGAGAFVPGMLMVTERDLDAIAAGIDELDYTADPYFGSVELQAGFAPDPYLSEVVGGGAVDASYLGGDCVGYAAQAPDVRLVWGGSSHELILFFVADAEGDTSLVVNLPDRTWVCNDDAGSLDPLIVLENPPEGQYDIWVGSYQPGQSIEGVLGITERRPQR